MAETTSVLLTDSYQLSMMQGYLENGMTQAAVFELFVRRLPPNRNFLVAAGLEQLIEYLEALEFTAEELDWLGRTGRYRPHFLQYLKTLRFTGDVDSLPEGTIFFPDEPIVRVVAPLPEAQLVESRLMNLIHFQTVIASKAARTTLIAPGKLLVDFGLRRAHGAEAGLLAARASYIAGFSGTSTVLAGELFQIPVFGTMAHSFIQSHDSESAAFENFAESHVGPITLLIDTYDTEAAASKIVGLLPKLAKQGIRVSGVRLDSGNLTTHSKNVRRIFDNAGLREIQIFVSGGLDENVVQRLLLSGAPIDGFGVGTAMTTSSDAPYLDCAYKLQEYAGRPKRKRSEGKAYWPGRKQVYRHNNPDGSFSRDKLALVGESLEGEPLLRPVMRGGRRLEPAVPAREIREYLLNQLSRLPSALRQLATAPESYRVDIDPKLSDLARQLDREPH